MDFLGTVIPEAIGFAIGAFLLVLLALPDTPLDFGLIITNTVKHVHGHSEVQAQLVDRLTPRPFPIGCINYNDIIRMERGGDLLPKQIIDLVSVWIVSQNTTPALLPLYARCLQDNN